jgi:acyl-CoA dehydrogenase
MVKQWAFDKALTIAGGTSEIQLNIIAKRALELPSASTPE